MRKSAQMATFDLTQSALEDLLMVIGESRHQVKVYAHAMANVTATRQRALSSVERARARLRDAERDLEAEEAELTTIATIEAALHRDFTSYLRELGHEQAEAASLCRRLGFEHLHPSVTGAPDLAASGAVRELVDGRSAMSIEQLLEREG